MQTSSLAPLDPPGPCSLPPGPRGPGWLHSFRYMRDPFVYYEQMRASYGDLFTLPSVNGRLVLACDPEHARQILAGREEDFEAGFGQAALAPIIGEDSLLLISGDAHRRERRWMSPAFHGARMRAYGPVAKLATTSAAAEWRPGVSLTTRLLMQQITIEVILRAVFGLREPAAIAHFTDVLRRAVTEVSPAFLFFPILQRLSFGRGGWGRFLRARDELHRMIQAQIDAARERGKPSDDLLSRLVFAQVADAPADARDDRGQAAAALGDRALRSQLLTLVLAGHETTATALAWAVYELCRNPSYADQLRARIGELGPDPEADALAALPELEAFCCETLRVHPIVAEFIRTVKHSFRIGDYTIPAGIHLAGAIIELHRNPQLYPEPEVFRPERFLERRFAPHEFAVFGGGHRHCLGAAFAMNEMKVVLGTLLSRVQFRLESPRPLRTVRRGLTLAPEAGVPIVIESL